MRELLRPDAPESVYESKLGRLFSGDCLKILPFVKDGVIDTVFADPPFNLGKKYGKRNSSDDRLSKNQYLTWCHSWINECHRTLSDGGSFFLFNIPRWNSLLGAYMESIGLTFRHWIAIDMTLTPAFNKRLYPSHYSLIYYTKGEPKTFRKIRTPLAKCRWCDREIKDYGGYKEKLNKSGIMLKDVWTDVPPVRHQKYKSKKRKANALSTKILDRVIEMSTRPGDVVMDPFGGSGTTFAVCESHGRRWLGIDIESADEIIDRLGGGIPPHKNDDVVEAD